MSKTPIAFQKMTTSITTDELQTIPIAKRHNSTLEEKTPRQTILIGMDGSESSKYAFQWVLDHIYHPGDHIILVKVVQESRADDILLLDQNWPKMFKSFMEEQVKNLHTKSMAILSSRFSRYSISTFVKTGDPRIELKEMVCSDFYRNLW